MGDHRPFGTDLRDTLRSYSVRARLGSGTVRVSYCLRGAVVWCGALRHPLSAAARSCLHYVSRRPAIMVHVSAINIYPIKSCKGITLKKANLTYTGEC